MERSRKGGGGGIWCKNLTNESSREPVSKPRYQHNNPCPVVSGHFSVRGVGSEGNLAREGRGGGGGLKTVPPTV